MVEGEAINATVGKEVLAEAFASGEEPGRRRAPGPAADQRGGATGRRRREALDANPRAVNDYLAGKAAALGFLVGQVMRLTRGQAKAPVAERLLREELERRRGGGT